MMKSIQKKYSKSKIDYQLLKKLEFEVIRKPDDGFYKMVDNSIRRNLSWKTEVILPQSTLFDLGRVVMLSRIHFYNSKIMDIRLSVSTEENGPFVNLFKDLIIISGNIRVLNVGNIPCRFFKVKVIRGSPLQEFNHVECFGMTLKDMQEIYDKETIELLLHSPYDLIYKGINK